MIRRTLLTTLALLLLQRGWRRNPPLLRPPLHPNRRRRCPARRCASSRRATACTGAFLLYWRVNGGLAAVRLPGHAELTEDGRTVQYTERARFELHENNTVLLGLLGSSVTAKPHRYPVPRGDARRAAARFFPETGHNLAEPFPTYWQSRGGLPVYGYPISEAVPGEATPPTARPTWSSISSATGWNTTPRRRAPPPRSSLGCWAARPMPSSTAAPRR